RSDMNRSLPLGANMGGDDDAPPRTAANRGARLITPVHPIDAARLAAWMRTNVVDFFGDLLIEQYQGGQSNPTYRITAGKRRFVLRRKPPGDLLPSAHSVAS